MTPLIVLQNCATVQLTQGKNSLIDAADAATVGQLNWSVSLSQIRFYARGSSGRHDYRPYMHRFLMGEPARLIVDHRNGDTLDNRRSNLRPCTPTENGRNIRRGSGVSRYKGLHFWDNRWVARIKIDTESGKVDKYLGRFRSEEDAARAYDDAARKYHGEFACTNAEIYGDLGPG